MELENLKRLREKSGLSQQALADQLNTTQQNIQRYENGLSEPDFKMLTQLADFFVTSVDHLMGHTQIQYKIEDIERYALSFKEESLIDTFREFTSEEQNLSMELLEVIKKNKK